MGSLWVLAARTLVVVGLCVAVIAASPTQAASVPEPIQLVEGSVVTLPQVLVTLTGQKWFFVKPLYASGPTISVWADADPPPTSGWTVNVTGRVLSASGKLFVYATRLELLIDPRTQMPCPPPVAGSVWADVRDIPLNLDAPTEGLVPPDPSSLIPIREPVEAAPGSIALALTRADASTITAMDVGHGSPDSSQVTLTGKVVTATRADFEPGYMYVEETNRTAGIRVKWSGAYEPARGDRVDVSGVVDTASDGERVIDADTGTPHGVTFVQTGTPLTPLGMINRAIGGSAFGPYSPGVDGGVGLFSKGLLVRTAGRVTSIDEPNKLFYITDGSLPDALKVSWDWPAGRPSIVPPQVGWKVGVTGLASSEVSGGSMLRVLRPRNQSDLGVYEPEDTTDPTVEITSPKGTTWHKASGATFIVISGTAEDDDTCVVKVEVKIGAGQYQPAVYDPVAKTWQYTWSPATFPASTTVYAKATDFVGRYAQTSVSVSIPTTYLNVIYVNCTRPDDSGNGQSWATAKKTIQGGVGAASSGYDVWVARGTYVNQSATISLGADRSLYGGFSGVETTREQRNWATNKTTIDGNGTVTQQCCITVAGDATSPDTTVIDGFTIQNGAGTDTGGISCKGIYTGWYPTRCSPTISHNIVRCNYLAYTSGEAGGVYCDYSSAVLANNWIVGNTLGGITVSDFLGSVVNNTIVGNSGYGLATFGTSSGTVRNNIVAFNESGIYGSATGTSQYSHNDVYGNTTCQYSWTTTPPADDLAADPRLVASVCGDLHVLHDSPCRDAGYPEVVSAVLIDIDSAARSDGAIDIGADEWVSADPVHSHTVVRVSPDGSDTDPAHDGSSWALAQKTIQKGIDTAYAAGCGEVWVKGATGAGLSYNEAVVLKPFVQVLGGFSGTDAQRNNNTYISVIDAYGKSASAVRTWSPGSYKYIGGHLVSIIDGFTLTRGTGYLNGGGLCCKYASPIVSHCSIKLNSITGNGGGVYCDHSSPVIEYNTIEQNTVTDSSSTGAGICYNVYCTPMIENNIIKGNSASGSSSQGGGLFAGGKGRIADNAIIGNSAKSGGGVYCSGGLSMVNNTIAYNTLLSGGTCGGVYLYFSATDVMNNIIASNAGAGVKADYCPSARLWNNDVWSNTPNYDLSSGSEPSQNANISIDPLLNATDHIHIGTNNGNDCKDKGTNGAVGFGDADIDGQYRLCDGAVDIGADEIQGCVAESIVATANQWASPPDSEAGVTVKVVYPLTGQPVSNRHVRFQVTTGGEITSITPEVPNMSGWGQTDANGQIELTISGSTGTVTLTATMTNGCNALTSTTCDLRYGYRVGFFYDLCTTIDDCLNDLDGNLKNLDSTFDDIAYSEISNLHSLVDGLYETVFVAMPARDLTSAETNVLLSFLQLGRGKRIVLVGEYCTDPYGYSLVPYNERLNNLAAALGMNSRFDTGTGLYDSGHSYTRLCPPNNSHYLTNGVVGLCDGATKSFVDTGQNAWQLCARAVAYVYDGYNPSAPSRPNVIEEDTSTVGSRVAIHDSNIILSDYTSHDTAGNKNARFMHNLCTIFPQ